MISSLFYNHIEINQYNKDFIEEVNSYIEEHSSLQLYLINTPLGENSYKYDYQDKAIVMLSPQYKIIFIDLNNNAEEFN